LPTINFAGGAGSYTPESGFEVIGGGSLLIDGSGRLYSPTDEVRRALRYTGTTSGIKTAICTLAAAGNTEGVLWGPAMLNSSGTGYAARCNGGVVTLSRIVAYEGVAELDSDNVTMSIGDDLTLIWDPSDGSLDVYSNETLYLSATDGTYTTGLNESAYFYSWTTTAQGITEFSTGDDDEPPPDANIGLRIKLLDRLSSPPANDTGYTVVVREAINSTAVLYETASAAIVDGYIEIDSDSVGSLEDEVYVSITKEGVSVAADKNASGRLIVVDLDTEDES
jgi:hypothetical protein